MINGINIQKGHHREPFEPLNDPSKLIIANWAFDANSYCGNEYWDGSLAASGDPAAASCSYVAYIGNPDLNKFKKVYYF